MCLLCAHSVCVQDHAAGYYPVRACDINEGFTGGSGSAFILHVHWHANIHVCTHARTHTYTHTPTHTHTHTHTRTQTPQVRDLCQSQPW